jgi:hypothetical protein
VKIEWGLVSIAFNLGKMAVDQTAIFLFVVKIVYLGAKWGRLNPLSGQPRRISNLNSVTFVVLSNLYPMYQLVQCAAGVLLGKFTRVTNGQNDHWYLAFGCPDDCTHHFLIECPHPHAAQS